RNEKVNKLLKNWGIVVAGPKTRWLTIFVWVFLVGVFSFIWPQVNEKETTNQQLLPDDMMSVEAADIVDEEFSDDAGTPLLLVWHRDGGLEEADYEMIQTLYRGLSEVPLDKQEFVPPFHQAPVEALIGSASEDEEALTTPVFFDGGTTTDEYKVILEDLR